MVYAVLLEALRNLGCQLACWSQDQGSGHSRPSPAGFQPRDHRKHERCRLAGSRLGNSQHVLTGQGDRDGLGLNGSWAGVAGCLDGGQNLWAESKLSKCFRRQKILVPHLRSHGPRCSREQRPIERRGISGSPKWQNGKEACAKKGLMNTSPALSTAPADIYGCRTQEKPCLRTACQSRRREGRHSAATLYHELCCWK